MSLLSNTSIYWCRGGDLNSDELFTHHPLKMACLPNSTTSANWQEWQDSNPRPVVLETTALPTELHSFVPVC